MKFAKHVKIREEKFGSVVFDTLKEKVFVANETGKDILQFLEKGKSREEIAQSLAQDYGAERDEIRNDVESFFDELKDNGLLETQE